MLPGESIMSAVFAFLAATSLSTATALAEEQTVALSDCPSAVQKTIKERAGTAEISEITKETECGDTEYCVTVKKGGKELDLYVAPDGNFLRWEEEVALKDCPVAVQKTFKARVGAAEITEINKETDDEGTEFVATVQKGDKKVELCVAPDGDFLRWEEYVVLNECPIPVVKTIRAAADDSRIEAICKETDDDAVTFVVTVKHGDKQREFSVGAQGKLLEEGATHNKKQDTKAKAPETN